MKLVFENATLLAEGIGVLAPDLGIEVADREQAQIAVQFVEEADAVVRVALNGNQATITYGGGSAKAFRGLAILADWLHNGETDKTLVENPVFQTTGVMVDMSRNQVLNVKTVKTMLRKLALMGMNTYMLYTEDTYEIAGRPYFGHMRGRYTKDEIKELDAYAQQLGIELVPCIQTLGHLSTHLQWRAATPYKDTDNAMLVGADETYALIDDMLTTICECFSSKRIHIGMDETHDVGLGNYLRINGYRKQADIYFEHLTRVIDMTHAHGLQPMMWSDMFFHLAGKALPDYADYDTRVTFTDELRAKVPNGIQQVFWDYYRPEEEFYATNIEKHQDLFGEIPLFAGGIWTWSGYGPLFTRSLMFTVPALDACRKKGVREVIATIWANGGECPLISALAGVAWYADYAYQGKFDLDSVKACFARACRGVSYDDVVKTELCEHPDGSKLSLSRAMLYNDPLIGLVDSQIQNVDVQDYYKNASAALASHGHLDFFAPAYDTIQKLSCVLEQKADYGVRLKQAYDQRDRQKLQVLADECDEIITKIEALRESHLNTYLSYNKPFGWEIYDLHYGGLITRFLTVKERITAFLSGAVSAIEELEEERLVLVGTKTEFDNRYLWMTHMNYASVGRF